MLLYCMSSVCAWYGLLRTCFILLCAVYVLFCFVFWWTIDFSAWSSISLGSLCWMFHLDVFELRFVIGQISLACSPIRELILIISNCNLFFKSNHILCHPHHIPLGVEGTWGAKWVCDDSAYIQIVFQVPSLFRTQFILLRNVTSSKQMQNFLLL